MRDLFSKSRNPSEFESLENEGYKVSFLGASFAKAHWVGVRGKESPIATITFAMVVTDSNNRVVDSKNRLPASAFASKDVEVSEKSISVKDAENSTGNSTEIRTVNSKEYSTENSKVYSIITLSAKFYEISIIRASELYADDETPHYVHLPSKLWQLIADSENEIKDFGSTPPVCTWLANKSAGRAGNDLTLMEFDPSRHVPDIEHDKFRFGIHFEPPQGHCRKFAYMFHVKH